MHMIGFRKESGDRTENIHTPMQCLSLFFVGIFPDLRESKVDDAMVSTEAVHQAAARVHKVLDSGGR